MIGPWEVTATASSPVMYCAAETGTWKVGAEIPIIRALLNRAKKEKVSVVAITLTTDDEGIHATLVGTRDDSR